MKKVDQVITLAGTPEDKRGWIYRLGKTGVRVREVEIESEQIDKSPVTVIQISDLHLGTLNRKDWEEQNPTLLSTYENRIWLKDGGSIDVTKKALQYAAMIADQIVITGDAMDYLSYGSAELLEELVWHKYPNTLVTSGNHEWVQRMQGAVPETLSLEERGRWLEEIWKPHHDFYYSSKLIKNKVLIIQLENSLCKFWNRQAEPLKNDLELARRKHYTVLIFAHVKLWANNPNTTCIDAIIPNIYVRTNQFNFNHTDDGNRGALVGFKAEAGSATEEIYQLIVKNADVVKGVFVGHEHADLYSEILGEHGVTGKRMMIPQYVLTTNAIDPYGAVLKITIK